MSQSLSSSAAYAGFAAVVVAVVIACRVWLAATMPLTDTTEARFSEMAQKMVESGDWVTPQHDVGVPYLAKPPLALWLAALGIEAAGADELGPRLPILGAGLAFCAMFFFCTRRWLGTRTAIAGILMLTTSGLFFVALGAVMTDLILTICASTALLAFWSRYRGGRAREELVLYVALGLGLLAKGPLVAILVLGPIAAWAVAGGRVGAVWRQFEWVKGAALAIAIALPWYALAELHNPGFLRYFMIGEHVQRFLVPGWPGDLYGRAHDVPRGAIWIFLLVGALPWSLLCIPMLTREREMVRRNWARRRGLVSFALTGALVPMALFTLSGNVILPYALPALPPTLLALLALLAPDEERGRDPFRGVLAASAITAAAFAVLAIVNAPFAERHSQRAIIRAIASRDGTSGTPVFYWRKRYFSAEYYSDSAVVMIEDAAAVATAIAARRPFWLVVGEHRQPELPADVARDLVEVGVFGGFALLEPEYMAAPKEPS